MNREEIKHFKAMLRQGSLRHMNILLDDKFQKELLNIIKDYEKLQQENNQLKEQYCERTDCGGRLGNSKKVERLENTIKELRNWLEAIKTMYENEYKDVNTAEHYNSVLSKLNELEGIKDEKV